MAPSQTSAASTDVLDAPTVQQMLRTAKCAYTTRRVDFSDATELLMGDDMVPASGDVVLARIDALGQHNRIELRTGRRASLYVGDLIVVAFGGRYAPDQFLADVPGSLAPCQLVAAGGIAATVQTAHARMSSATSITPLGILANGSGERINLRAHALPPTIGPASKRPATIAVVGSSMNAGKTTAAASLVHGLRAAGLRVDAAKVTGTGAGGDTWLFTDAGADNVYDFVDAGVPSTYGLGASRVRDVFDTLTAQLDTDAADVDVIEVADGIGHVETATLLLDPAFAARVDGIVFACQDSLGAVAGIEWLRTTGLPVLALTGLMTASPLAAAEARTALPDIDIDSPSTLMDADRARVLHERATDWRDTRPAAHATVFDAFVREHPVA